jgi:UDPglucose 6-dehydrogenase
VITERRQLDDHETCACLTSRHAGAPQITPIRASSKSTTPVGTAAALADRLAALAPAGPRAELAWNPEFLREGYAVADTLRPARIVAGVRSAYAEAVLRDVYRKLTDAGTPLLLTDLATAELAKAAANAFLATKISFINAMAEVCEAAGADVTVLADVLGRDTRIGAAGLRPGLGFGGGCLPKDIRALRHRGEELGAGPALSFLRDVDSINLRCRSRTIAAARELAGGSLQDQAVGVLGAAFKPGSDDIRESPALAVAVAVCGLGARVTVYDPAAAAKAVAAYPQLKQADSAEAAARDADMLLVLTEWDEFRDADPEILGKAVRRNCWNWPPSGSRQPRRPGHDRAGPYAAAVLHRAAGPAGPGQPADGDLLQEYLPAAAEVHPAAHRQSSLSPGLGRPRRRYGLRVPGLPRGQPR